MQTLLELLGRVSPGSMRRPQDLGEMVGNSAKELVDAVKGGFTGYPEYQPGDIDTNQMINLVDNLGGMNGIPGALGGAIKAFHGSPHKFSKFKDKAIGSGEGTQAFGDGHYSGESVTDLDSWYRDRLSEHEVPTVKADNWVRDNPQLAKDYEKLLEVPNDKVEMSGDYGGLSFKEKLEGIFQDIEHFGSDNPMMNGLETNSPGYEALMSMNSVPPVNPGYGYMLNLKPDQKDLLHFDKKLSDHPQSILDLLGVEKGDKRLGSNYHKGLEAMLGSDGTKKELMERGIPGHSFPGQGGKGKPNYVIYDPEDIEIVRRVRGGLDSKSPKARQSLIDYMKGSK